MTELCARFHVTRKTGYKCYRDGGLDALGERSRTPKRCPHRTPEPVRQLLIATRRAHPRWGPRKLLDYLRPRHPEVAFPAPSTAGDLLKREGLVPERRRKRRRAHPGASPIEAEAPGRVWSADFKGEFRLGSGAYCYPLTIQDAHSRYLLACAGQPSTAHRGAAGVFSALFRERGLPVAIRTDNGSPFASQAICGLSRLSLWWTKLGIRHDRIRPGCPEQNGRHERMHRTLKAETTRPPGDTFAGQQERSERFQNEYNHVRPHQALDGATPASRHAWSALRAMPAGRLPDPTYPGHAEVRRVSSAGTIKLKAQPLFVSHVLGGEYVALEETGEGIWSLWFYDVLLGRLDERTFTLHTGAP